jgi:hypothetical protein
MEQNRPSNIGEYDRPMTRTSSSMAITVGVLALMIVLIVLAFILL